MKLLPFVFVAASMLAAGPAMADPTAPSKPGYVAVPTVVVYGRVDKPNVVILVKVPTAAAAAGAAHESLRAALLEGSVPVALRVEH